MSRLVEIDGSMGEGGGQILRTALALSAIVGVPIRIFNIRAKRKNPGLRPQHLTAVKAIASLSRGRVRGAYVGSRELYFEPGAIKGGVYEFDVGTAGSISLVLQALLPVMAYADGPVKVRIKGGTDVPMAPTIDFLRLVLKWHLSAIGYNVEIKVERRGHYPRGGGIVEAVVDDPPKGFKARDYLVRGKLLKIGGRSHAVRLPKHVAERQARAAVEVIKKELGTIDVDVEIEWYPPQKDPHLGPGSGVTLYAVFENTILGSDALGAKGKRAEVVGEEAARKLLEDIKTGASLDRHMSDMIIPYLALADRESRIWGAKLTLHALTVFELIKFIIPDYSYSIERGKEGESFIAIIKPGSILP
jgi:RNA 3'-terminal phosphate cyclase (ATP)